MNAAGVANHYPSPYVDPLSVAEAHIFDATKGEISAAILALIHN